MNHREIGLDEAIKEFQESGFWMKPFRPITGQYSLYLNA